MWALVALIFFGLCIWQGYLDYTETLGQGQAYRMSSVEAVWERLSPDSYATYFPMLEASDTALRSCGNY